MMAYTNDFTQLTASVLQGTEVMDWRNDASAINFRGNKQ